MTTTRSLRLLSALALVGLATSAHADSSDVKPYYAANVGVITGPIADLGLNCAGDSPSIGGTCFEFPPGTTTISLMVHDQVTSSGVPVTIQFFTNSDPVNGIAVESRHDFCDATQLDVPPDAHAGSLFVYAVPSGNCAGGGSLGTVTAQYS